MGNKSIGEQCVIYTLSTASPPRWRSLLLSMTCLPQPLTSPSAHVASPVLATTTPAFRRNLGRGHMYLLGGHFGEIEPLKYLFLVSFCRSVSCSVYVFCYCCIRFYTTYWVIIYIRKRAHIISTNACLQMQHSPAPPGSALGPFLPRPSFGPHRWITPPLGVIEGKYAACIVRR